LFFNGSSLRRISFIDNPLWSFSEAEKKTLKFNRIRLTVVFPTTVLAKATSAGWVPSEGEGIRKHPKQFSKQAGGVALQERSPAA